MCLRLLDGYLIFITRGTTTTTTAGMQHAARTVAPKRDVLPPKTQARSIPLLPPKLPLYHCCSLIRPTATEKPGFLADGRRFRGGRNHPRVCYHSAAAGGSEPPPLPPLGRSRVQRDPGRGRGFLHGAPGEDGVKQRCCSLAFSHLSKSFFSLCFSRIKAAGPVLPQHQRRTDDANTLRLHRN